jgi:hypothetical protein
MITGSVRMRPEMAGLCNEPAILLGWAGALPA